MQNTAQKQRPQRPSRPVVPPEYKAAAVDNLDEAALIDILKNADTSPGAVFRKAKACHRLAQVGTVAAVPPLAALLGDPRLAHYARFALEAIPDAAAGDALRAALPKFKGELLVGIINSLGQRQDAKAVDALARLLYGANAEVARAAASALGYAGGAQAGKILQDGLVKTKGPLREAVAQAALVCAEGLLRQGDRKGALALYRVLGRPDLPKAVRVAAMHSTIAAEVAIDRPKSAP